MPPAHRQSDDGERRSRRLSRQFVSVAVRHCPALQTLELRPSSAPPRADEIAAAAALGEGEDDGRYVGGGYLDSPLPQLRELCLSRVALGPALASNLIEHSPLLEVVRLHACVGFTAAFAAALRGLPRLQTLEIDPRACGVDDEELALTVAVLPAQCTLRPVRPECATRSWLPAALLHDGATAALWAHESVAHELGAPDGGEGIVEVE